jgi:serine phosphatase RsbU (regulator of sigma subunit)
VLVIVTDGVREALDSEGRMLGATGIAQALLPHAERSAKELVERLRAAVAEHQADAATGQAALVLKRRHP